MELVLQQFVNALSLGGTYALLALGLALIFSILGMINFAHGDLMTIAGYSVVFLVQAGAPFWPACGLAVLVSGGAAIVMERVAFRPIRGRSLAIMLLTSFAVSGILHVGFQNLISPRPIALAVPDVLARSIAFGGITLGVVQLISVGATFLLLGVLTLVLQQTRYGIAVRAAAQDFPVSRLMGIRANQLIALTFGVSGMLAGVAGLLWVAQRGAVDPLLGFLPILKAFIATVLGGLGSLPGAVLGGFMLGALEVSLRALLPPDALPFRDAIALSLVILLLLGRPQGLLGRRHEER